MKNIRTKTMIVVINIILVSLKFTTMAQHKNKTLKSSPTAHKIYYRKVNVDGLKIFYRESGARDAPVLLLLHGYPTSSHMFRSLIPILSEKYHVIAPDLPGFGFSDSPDRNNFKYTFENLALVMQEFIDVLELKRFAVYVFDYGAPTGYRLMMANPEKITGFISQNGNAYEEGLGSAWDAVKRYWTSNSKKDRDALRGFVREQELRFQYFTGVDNSELIAPETYTLDQYFLDRPEADEKQLDLLYDYRHNVDIYPEFQKYFREHRPKALIVWGNKDPYFLPEGAQGYKRDLPKATVKLYDTGHFALETHVLEIGQDILSFMETLPD